MSSFQRHNYSRLYNKHKTIQACCQTLKPINMNESEFAEEVERYETEKKRLELYDQVEVYEEYIVYVT